MPLSFQVLCSGLSGFRDRLQGDFIAELRDLPGEALDLRLGRPAVEVGGEESWWKVPSLSMW